MKRNRTNIYLDQDQQRLLKHLAVENNVTVAELVRQAITGFWIPRVLHNKAWAKRFRDLIESVQQRVPDDISAEEIEADIETEVVDRKKRRTLA
ncbi:MAG: CopG family transcriptional regulator [Candidatus Eremiobacter antarcticus]|nr:MAG: CopG family transcriptional regulator [Candidatus Eremiobacter sp. RRmetagenome_bin22]